MSSTCFFHALVSPVLAVCISWLELRRQITYPVRKIIPSYLFVQKKVNLSQKLFLYLQIAKFIQVFAWSITTGGALTMIAWYIRWRGPTIDTSHYHLPVVQPPTTQAPTTWELWVVIEWRSEAVLLISNALVIQRIIPAWLTVTMHQ